MIIYGTSVRHADGKVYAHSAYLPKPFHEYKDEVEVLQALMDMSEEFIRKYPDQYLWFYRRFQYIPQGATDELTAKYPFYAKMASNHFMRANQE